MSARLHLLPGKADRFHPAGYLLPVESAFYFGKYTFFHSK